jgi:sugar phosphate isomerase/epimerase
MQIYFSELCLLGGDIEKNVDRLVAAGAANVELMLDGAGWNDFHLRKEEIARALRGKKIGYSVHVPVWGSNLSYENSQYRAAVLESYRQSIDFAALLGARHVVLHPGSCPSPQFSREVARERSREAMLSLLEHDERYGLLLLVENVGTSETSLFTEAQFADFLEGMPDRIGYLVDIGHAQLCGWDIPALLPALGDRLHALHVHDNDGKRDLHAPIGSGLVDWDRVLGAAAATGRDLGMVIEYDMGTELAALAEGAAFLEAAAARKAPRAQVPEGQGLRGGPTRLLR